MWEYMFTGEGERLDDAEETNDGVDRGPMESDEGMEGRSDATASGTVLYMLGGDGERGIDEATDARAL